MNRAVVKRLVATGFGFANRRVDRRERRRNVLIARRRLMPAARRYLRRLA